MQNNICYHLNNTHEFRSVKHDFINIYISGWCAYFFFLRELEKQWARKFDPGRVQEIEVAIWDFALKIHVRN